MQAKCSIARPAQAIREPCLAQIARRRAYGTDYRRRCAGPASRSQDAVHRFGCTSPVAVRSSSGGPQASTATVVTSAPASAASSIDEDALNNGAAAGAPVRAVAAPPPAAAGMRLSIAACCLPHPDKHHYGGEDAFFVSAAGGGALGVADGVGGWAESGVNPAQYSRTLMRVACAYIEGLEGEELARAAAEGARAATADASLGGPVSGGAGGGEGGGYAYAFGGASVAAAGGSTGRGYVDPRAALDAAHRRTRCAGSATAVVLQLDSAKRRLVAANLGDSGFIVARGGQIIARSRPLQHFFDCPLQLGAYPEFVDATDTAAQAEVFEVPLVAGDVIVAGSDGLWDNMYDTDILPRLPRSAADAQAAAEAIAALAREQASDPTFPSPYTREARQQGYDLPWFEKIKGATIVDGQLKLAELTGGKQDDITVIVSVVEDGGAAAAASAA